MINDQQLYKSILAGKGQYKVIGKPGDTHAKATIAEDDGDDTEAPVKQEPEKKKPADTPKKKGG